MASAESVAGGRAPELVLYISEQGAPPQELVDALRAAKYRVEVAEGSGEGLRRIGDVRPSAVVLQGGFRGKALGALRDAARAARIALVEVCERSAAQDALRHYGAPRADGWFFLGAPAEELPARVGLALARHAGDGATAAPAATSFRPIDTFLLSLIIHDLRTPLSVIQMSQKMLEQSVPRGDPDLDEDLAYLRDNAAQMVRILADLSEYCQLMAPTVSAMPFPFDPLRLVSELLERWTSEEGAGTAVQVEPVDDCPREVDLDQRKAQLAIQMALRNAAAAAGGAPVRVRLGGGPDRWRIELAVDRPPPAQIRPMELQPFGFERLVSMEAERRGIDLAIAARVSELFGGSARLEVDAGRGTRVVLDWPARRSQGASI